MSAFPEIEYQTNEAIRTLQLDLFRKAFNYASLHSPFYRRKLTGIASIEDLSQVRRIPVTTKDELQQYNDDFLAVPRSDIAEYTSTSGTLGKPVTIALTRKDVDRLAYNEFISFACADGRSDDLYQLMVTLDRQFMAGIAYYEGIRKLGAGLVRVGPGLPALQWETIFRLKPTVLVSVPSFLVKLTEYAAAAGIDANSSSVRKAICIGESIRTDSFEPNALASRIMKSWKISLYGTYAATEIQTAFTECAHGKGGHHHPGLVYIELLDRENNPALPGTAGEITITTFGVEGMPLLRYKTGDIAVLHDGLCKCGRTTARLGPVLGRKQQMIKLKGTTIYPQGIFEILNAQAGLENYAVEVTSDALGQDELRLYLAVPAEQQTAIANDLRIAFQARLRVMPDLQFRSSQEVEVMQLSVNSRKLSKLIDLRRTAG